MNLSIHNKSNMDITIMIEGDKYYIHKGASILLQYKENRLNLEITVCKRNSMKFSLVDFWTYDGSFLPSMMRSNFFCDCNFSLISEINNTVNVNLVTNKAKIAKHLYLYSIFPTVDNEKIENLNFLIKATKKTKRKFYLMQILFCSALPVLIPLLAFSVQEHDFTGLLASVFLICSCTIPSLKKIAIVSNCLNDDTSMELLSKNIIDRDPIIKVESALDEGMSNPIFTKNEKAIIKLLKIVFNFYDE